MQAHASRLTSALPEGWGQPELIEDVILADGVELYRAGICVRSPAAEEITGSAAGARGEVSSRAWFELLERISTLDAIAAGRGSYALRARDGHPLGWTGSEAVFPTDANPGSFRHSRSNGVALHRDWVTASDRAFFELAERDRLLRSWSGELTPVALRFDVRDHGLARSTSFAWSAFAVPESDCTRFSRELAVAVVIGFPHDPGLPLVLGYAARRAAEDAVASAVVEAKQSLAFMWGEAVPTAVPPHGTTAMHHLEHFQYAAHREQVRGWLDGGHAVHAAAAPRTSAEDIAFVDLTPAWLSDDLKVVRAIAPGCLALGFGEHPAMSHLPEPLRIHPIA